MARTTKFLLLSIISFLLVIILNDVEDTLAHHYNRSVFWDEQGYESYWYPDWTRKYVEGDPAKGRKKFWVFDIPALMFDGWHLTKAVRQYFMINAYAFILIAMAFVSPSYTVRSARRDYVKILIYAALIIFLSHTLLYENLFLREGDTKAPPAPTGLDVRK